MQPASVLSVCAMAKKKSDSAQSKKPASKPAPKTAPLVVVPPRPMTELRGAVPLALQPRSTKRPLDPRKSPGARDSRGTATRTEIRREAPRRSAPRQVPATRTGKPKDNEPVSAGSRKTGSKGARPKGAGR